MRERTSTVRCLRAFQHPKRSLSLSLSISFSLARHSLALATDGAPADVVPLAKPPRVLLADLDAVDGAVESPPRPDAAEPVLEDRVLAAGVELEMVVAAALAAVRRRAGGIPKVVAIPEDDEPLALLGEGVVGVLGPEVGFRAEDVVDVAVDGERALEDALGGVVDEEPGPAERDRRRWVDEREILEVAVGRGVEGHDEPLERQHLAREERRRRCRGDDLGPGMDEVQIWGLRAGMPEEEIDQPQRGGGGGDTSEESDDPSSLGAGSPAV